ncbi:MAG: Ig-like domain-containing protein [Gammaproteobacteria bacterium]
MKTNSVVIAGFRWFGIALIALLGVLTIIGSGDGGSGGDDDGDSNGGNKPEDITAPVINSVEPIDTSLINGSTSIIVVFSESMDTGSLVIGGEFAADGVDNNWGTSVVANDILTLTPHTAWQDDASHSLVIDATDLAGNALETATYHYHVDATAPSPSVSPSSGATIGANTAVVIGFDESIATASISVSGAMANDGYALQWSSDTHDDDTLTITPETVWAGGNARNLQIDGSDLAGNTWTVALTYNIDDISPTVLSTVPLDGGRISSSAPISFVFSETIDVDSIRLSGELASETATENFQWSSTTVSNDTLSITPITAWSDGADQTISVEFSDVSGNVGMTKSLTLTVDSITPAIVSVTPTDGSLINASQQIQIQFSEPMDTATLVLSGSMAAETDSDHWSWSQVTLANDTLTISPTALWSGGSNRTLVIDASDIAGNPLATLSLTYTVDTTIPTASPSPPTQAVIATSEAIVLIYTESMAPGSLALGGTLEAQSDGGTWSTTIVANDTLTINPTTVWDTASTATLEIDAEDLVGNGVHTAVVYSVNIVHVSKYGSDANFGSQSLPVLTIEQAITVAEQIPIANIYIADGDYAENVELSSVPVSPFTIEGGFDNNWVQANHTEPGHQVNIVGFRSTTPVTTVNVISPGQVIFRNLVITGRHASTTPAVVAQSSYTVYARDTNLTLENVTIHAGDGQPGSNGASASNQTQTPAGGGDDGQDAIESTELCDDTTRLWGGAGASAGDRSGGDGGRGGTMDTQCPIFLDSGPGEPGENAPITGIIGEGEGGMGGLTDCSQGEDGFDGLIVNGQGGTGASTGFISTDYWRSGTGENGIIGLDGGGGGGGGGAAGCDTGTDEYGAGGGGGGSGGLRTNSFGRGGSGGGSSFAVFGVRSTLTITDSTIVRGSGGDGGRGGDGGLGQPGGLGGLGGLGVDGGDGGTGGDGGHGGHSGAGAGGPGGSAYAIFSSDSTVNVIYNNYSGGTAGSGGSGGVGDVSNPGLYGADGPDGSLYDVAP